MDHGAARLSVADLIGCRALSRATHDDAVAAFTGALTRAGATIVKVVSHSYPGQGLTCVTILEESHAVMHTWPESGLVHVDIFTCSGALRASAAIAELGRAFEAVALDVREVPRASAVVT